MRKRQNPLYEAIRLAVEKHEGQSDKAGAPYILHPLRLMMRMDDDLTRIAAVLHDVVEDTPTTLADIRDAGIPEEAVAMVDLLTKRRGQSITAYYRALAAHPGAGRVKLADLEDNMDIRRLSKITDRDVLRLRRYRRRWDWLRKQL